MTDYRQKFIQFALEHNALKLGEFTLKSGRISPYFFNAGTFSTGQALGAIGRFYADAIIASGLEFDVLFGPAYKGIPLAAATSMALAEKTGKAIPWVFNRKEAKDHGEGGNLVGAPLIGRVLIIDDVITAGTAIRESLDLIQSAGATAVGVTVMMDRQERGQTALSAIGELKRDYGLAVITLACLDDLIAYCDENAGLSQARDQMSAYRARYGTAT
ncbi:MAG: orotate phosphoribosyltransferase [Halothiobacillus sp. 24-54-40]|nr:MAG: orotate phosphoribosyltransferase [Halothiobacillus sp. 35-54-62]OYZ86822.1 MAG: orotate phosphoribosyltransferase [Halothiobacillus sp. 24-54-40]OZA80996.1 MAG: orotate phosphoribosyltransferase [Halothiobacillus sp. 39-53-45]HQS02536.1 orotate phosphoribosyltransferase [Halothiobacillus sp.]HQS29031.1 orotate phosphoribosyltransferase [Halothiobacillus sp.]